MNSLRAYFKKEIKEGVRGYKFIILGVAIIIFAILDPLLLKLLPTILKNQAPGLDLTQLIDYTQQAAIQNYMKNLYQIVNLVIVLTLMGLLSDEIKNKTLVMPYLKNAKISEIILAKFIVYSIVIFLLTIIGLLINYYYSNLLFNDGIVEIKKLLKSSIIFGLYFVFNISLIIFMSSMFKKSILAGILSLSIIYLTPGLSILGDTVKFIPYFLVKQANILDRSYDTFILKSIIITLIYTSIMIMLASYKIKRTELS